MSKHFWWHGAPLLANFTLSFMMVTRINLEFGHVTCLFYTCVHKTWNLNSCLCDTHNLNSEFNLLFVWHIFKSLAMWYKLLICCRDLTTCARTRNQLKFLARSKTRLIYFSSQQSWCLVQLRWVQALHVKVMTGRNKFQHYLCGCFGCSEIETFFNDLRIKYVVLTHYMLKMDLTWPVWDSFIITEV